MSADNLIKISRNHLNSEDETLIKKAFTAAEHAHGGQKRKNGEPYFSHCLGTAETLASWGLDAEVISAGLLHDTVEDTGLSPEILKKEFGETIASLVDGVTKLGHFKYRERLTKKEEEERRTENFKKLILALSDDIRIILIKLADRLHNMKTLLCLPGDKQKRIALETYEIYAPLAYRLGMTNLSGELEDLAFPYLHPNEYQWLMDNVPEKYEKRIEYLKEIKPILEEAFRGANIESIKIDFRAKRYSSLYKKLKRYEMNFDQIHDLVALRVVLKTVEDCYRALGIIHDLWPPLPGRFKDYIALPKPNGYQSLHTTVFCKESKITEIQIRTEEMHEEAENGIAAHWAYSEKKGGKAYAKRLSSFADKKELSWIKQLREWQESTKIPNEEFIGSLKTDFFKDRIFAVTPKGDVIDLPVNATPIDFAYRIHSDIGDEARGAKVNGRIVPMNYELKSGDVVEILRQKGKKPSEDWLKFVKTQIAREHIKSATKKQGIFQHFNLKKK